MKLSRDEMISYAAVLVIVVSLASIGMQLTGFATYNDTAVVNVTITSLAAINFTADFIDFGEGVVNNSGTTLNTNGTAPISGNWSQITDNLTLENIGNVNVSLGLLADKDADAFLGGASPLFQYYITEDLADSCTGGTTGVYTDFTMSNVTVCPNFPFNDAMDRIAIDIMLYIPSDSFTGEQTATITATGYVP